MNRIQNSLLGSIGLLLSMVFLSQACWAQADASDSDLELGTVDLKFNKSSQESIEIKPYTGPPIYLDEPEPSPPATIVEHRPIVDRYPDGTVRTEREIARYSDNRLVSDGYYREFFPSGKKFVEGNYQKGRQQGEWTYWHENGKKNRTVTYQRGQPDGSWEIFRSDGTRLAKRGFTAGKRHGPWIVYDAIGEQSLKQENYDHGKADGEWSHWYPSGQLRQQMNFKQGVRDGSLLEWNEEGSKRGELNFVDGKPHGKAIAWTSDGRRIVQVYEHGLLISESKE